MERSVIESMSCSCPYADDGNHCKHMAAVLYELEEGGYDLSVDAESKETLEQAVNRLSEVEAMMNTIERVKELAANERNLTLCRLALRCNVSHPTIAGILLLNSLINRNWILRRRFGSQNFSTNFSRGLAAKAALYSFRCVEGHVVCHGIACG